MLVCLAREVLNVSGIKRKEPKMAADMLGRVYIRGRGPPLYVTHFLYHIPRLYCLSSPVSFLLFGANSCFKSSHRSWSGSLLAS